MTNIEVLESRIRETVAAIASHERAISERPSPSLEASLQSLQKRLKKLRSDAATMNPDRRANNYVNQLSDVKTGEAEPTAVVQARN